MRISTERLLTTHTGSLARPAVLRDAAGDDYEPALRSAVREVVRRQVEAGVDTVSDGEMSKPSYATYIAERASGFGGQRARPSGPPEARDFPEWGEFTRAHADGWPALPACDGEIRRTDTASVGRDIANLKDAVAEAGATEGFMTASSPGVISTFLPNQYYSSHEAYLEALSEVMRQEYEEIHRSGLTLQVDCPDLAAGRYLQHGHLGLQEWKADIRGHVEALNAATSAIPADAMRLHLCWGNYNGPHSRDVPLREILDIVLLARPTALSFEAANPRHEHEWAVFQDARLPDDKVLIPGVIDSTTSYVEHPELVAQRLVRFAGLVGRERVIAGTDCGFGTFAASPTVLPSIAYAKLRALAEGAEIASRQLW